MADQQASDKQIDQLADKLKELARRQQQERGQQMLEALEQHYHFSIHTPFKDLSREVREALTRLAEQKLARATPQQGFMVTPVSAQHLTELTDARLEIEIIVGDHRTFAFTDRVAISARNEASSSTARSRSWTRDLINDSSRA